MFASLDKPIQRLLIPIAIAVLASVGLFIIRSVGLKWLDRWKNGNAQIIRVFRLPSFCWVFAVAIYVGIAFSELNPKFAHPLYQTIHVIIILSVSLVAGNLSVHILKRALETGRTTPISGLSIGIIRGAWMVLGVLLCLTALGISVAPLLTALGVGGLAVALALKDTLENLFAGIYLLTDRTIRVGDWVKLEGGQEACVQDIGWRTSRFMTGNNTTLILPNSKLSQSVVNNYSLPERRFASSIALSVAMSEDPVKIEEVVLGVTKKGSEDIVGLLSSPEPTVRLDPGFGAGFGTGSLDLTLSFSVRDFPDQTFVRHELRKRILKKFHEEGISLPKKSISVDASLRGPQPETISSTS
jgi:small-conductance mechanosensitive channel